MWLTELTWSLCSKISVKRLGRRWDSWLVDNGATAHDVRPYLTAEETGRAILNGLNAAPSAKKNRG